VRSRAWSLLLVLPALALLVALTAEPVRSFHVDLALAGTPGRFADVVVRAGRADARGAMWLANLVALAWLATVPRVLRAGVERWAPERRRLLGPWRHAPAVALAAGVLDLGRNALALATIGRADPPSLLTHAVATLTWWTAGLYLASLVALAALVAGPLAAPWLRPALRRAFGALDRLCGTHPHVPSAPAPSAGRGPEERTADEPRPGAEPPGGERIGICLSGGGIRAASVALGALRALDRPAAGGSPSLFRRARWLVAVSGGAYVAGGWRVTRRPGGRVAPPPDARRDGLFDPGGPWATTVRARRRFLDNGALSIAGGVVAVIARSLAVLGGVLAGAYVVGWAGGRLVTSAGVHPHFPSTPPPDPVLLRLRDLVPLRLVLPGGVLVLLGLSMLLGGWSRASPRERGAVHRAGALAVGAGAALLVLLVGLPAAIVQGPRALRALPLVDRPDEGAGVLGLLSALGVLGALTGVVVAQLKRRWLRLGGVLLAVGVVLFAGKVADVHARSSGGPWVRWVVGGTRIPVVVVAVVWLALLECVAAHRLALGGLYRKRLSATFVLGDGDEAPLRPLPYAQEPCWSAYAGEPGPELIVAATAHSSRPTFGGVAAFGFTFRPDRVTLHDRTDGTSASVPVDDYPTGSWWDGYPRGWIVSRAMALTGAAFASAMGRQALGTTNSLLAALNLRLGAWVPNPRRREWFDDPVHAPRVHSGYFVKELLGRYDPARDPFVYVADGGHRENLGLVELLRERPDVVLCVDASGDPPGSFRTLAEAIQLAEVELDVDVQLDLARLRPSADGLRPLDCVAAGSIRYPEALGGGVGRLVYGRAQLCDESPAALWRFGGTDRRFPAYSTADQFLREDEHLQLVALGEHVGERMSGQFEGATP